MNLSNLNNNELTILAVHAHPDDESISTGGVLAKYAAKGFRTVLAYGTGGEAGDIRIRSLLLPNPDWTSKRSEQLSWPRPSRYWRWKRYIFWVTVIPVWPVVLKMIIHRPLPEADIGEATAKLVEK